MHAGKPQHIKLINEALIREALASRGEATTADLVSDTGLSQTTVGQVLDQMRQAGIIRDTGKRASSGGRRASAWVLDPAAWTSIAIAIEGESLSWCIANALGSLTSQGSRLVKTDPLRDGMDLAVELETSAAPGQGREIRRALALGLPGAVKDGRLITGDFLEAWVDLDIPALFAEKTGMPVVVENDLNAVALGYAKAAEAGGYRLDSLVYIHFNGGSCIGSGLVFGGRILRGASNYSGELGFLPMGDGRVLDDVILAAEADDERYVEAIVRALGTVNCVVNPALLVVGGRGFRFDLGDEISARFKALVDLRVRPKLVFVPDSLPHYMAGLVGLAAERIFPDFRLMLRGDDD
jgi:predicted NBD/HSP70 family sugar kinase